MFSRAVLLFALAQSVALRVCLGQSEGDIRLVGAPRYGRLDIFWKGRWGTVCELSKEGGDAACRQLGYGSSNGVLRYSTTPEAIPKAGDDMPIALGSASCGYSEIHILRCSYSTDTSACSHDQDVVLDCNPADYTYDRSPYDTQVRLISDTFPSTGTLEIYINKQWGNACHAQFDQGAADSACRQLGYTNAKTLSSTKTSSASRVWLSGVQCGSRSYECLRCCFKDEEPNVPTTCPDNNYLTIQCTFDISKADKMSSAGNGSCEYNHCSDYSDIENYSFLYVEIFVPVGIIGFILFCICFVISCVICLCLMKQNKCSCCRNRRRRPRYNIIPHPDELQ